jgi:hypothetical protein
MNCFKLNVLHSSAVRPDPTACIGGAGRGKVRFARRTWRSDSTVPVSYLIGPDLLTGTGLSMRDQYIAVGLALLYGSVKHVTVITR